MPGRETEGCAEDTAKFELLTTAPRTAHRTRSEPGRRGAHHRLSEKAGSTAALRRACRGRAETTFREHTADVRKAVGGHGNAECVLHPTILHVTGGKLAAPRGQQAGDMLGSNSGKENSGSLWSWGKVN